MRYLLILTLSLAAVAADLRGQVAAPPLELTFHVRVPEPEISPEGFVDAAPDKALADTVKDLVRVLDGAVATPTKGFPGSKARYRHVENSADADIVLTVVARGLNAESYGSRTQSRFYRGAVLSETTPIIGNTRWISVLLTVDTYRKELVGSWTNTSEYSMGAWTEAAKIVANSATAWVAANEAQIVKRRAERLGVPVSDVLPKQPTCMTRDGKVIPCREPEPRR
jgi:hypothetical protein